MLELLKKRVGLMPISDPAILRAIISRLPGLYRTSRYAVDNDMVIGLEIHHHQLIPRLCFVAISYKHCIVYILVYIKTSEV